MASHVLIILFVCRSVRDLIRIFTYDGFNVGLRVKGEVGNHSMRRWWTISKKKSLPCLSWGT